MRIIIEGHSDDHIEIVGDFEKEFSVYSERPSFLEFSDGTVIRVEYKLSGAWRGCWKIETVTLGPHAQATIIETAEGMRSRNYTDRLELVTTFETIRCVQEIGIARVASAVDQHEPHRASLAAGGSGR